MNEKLGGGSGGTSEPPGSDVKTLDGVFSRDAMAISLMTYPRGGPVSCIDFMALGDGGNLRTRASQKVVVRTGDMVDYAEEATAPEGTEFVGVAIYAPGDGTIQLQRGKFGDPDSQSVRMSHGAITIDAGVSGVICLKAGPAGSSSIEIRASGITIKGPLLRLN
jgi:hypothetical protein